MTAGVTCGYSPVFVGVLEVVQSPYDLSNEDRIEGRLFVRAVDCLLAQMIRMGFVHGWVSATIGSTALMILVYSYLLDMGLSR